MKVFTYKDEPIKVFGVPFFEQRQTLYRLPDELIEKLPDNYNTLGKRCPGSRIGFRTDATEFELELTLETLSFDIAMSIYSCQAAEVHIGQRGKARYAALVTPPDYETRTFSKKIYKSAEMEDVMIYLPRNEAVIDLKITFPDDAAVEAPTPYEYGPILYYGSSITEGGCSTRVTNAYTAMLSDRLDVDYYNFGFSGSAKGELDMADYIASMDIRALVYDYDHNAPNAEHLRRTHETFFKRIREKHPELPVLMMSRPDFDYDSTCDERRTVIKSTYENALASGDKNVYFLDGQDFFGKAERELCTVDRCHPNDLGFYRMAEVVEPVLREMLKIK